MLLAVDIGNTSIVAGILEGATVICSGRIDTDRDKGYEDYLLKMRQMTAVFGIREEDIDGCVMSSVVPELTTQVSKATELLTGKPAVMVSNDLDTGLDISGVNARTLGNDRIADAVCAINEHAGPVIIIDMGTATTISVVSTDRKFKGGLIIPGVQTSLNALSEHASQLPSITIEAPEHVIGTNTINCMKSGVVFGFASMIDGLIERISAERREQMTVVATGGLAKNIIPYCHHNIILDENLLLKGMYYIYERCKTTHTHIHCSL